MTPPPGWPPQGAPPGWPPPAGPPPWPMAPVPMFMPVYLPPPAPLPARDRWLAAILIGEAVLGPLAIIGLGIVGFGNGPGSLGFKAAGLLFAIFFLSIGCGPIVLRDIAGRTAPPQMVPLVGLTVLTLAALGVTVGVIFTTSGQQAPSSLPLGSGLFTASAAELTVLNVFMIRGRQTGMAVPALGVVFGALSMAGGLLITIVQLSHTNGMGFGASVAGGLLIVFGFICYLIWAVALGIVVLRRPLLPPGTGPP